MLNGFLAIAILIPILAAGDSAPLADRFGLVHGDPEFVVDLGTAWNRHDFTWSGIERTKDHFDYGEFPARVDRSIAMGVKLLPILDYNPAWDPDVSPADDETLDYWARYVERTVTEFKGKLLHWQVWNEPNYGFWKPASNPRDYTELLRRSYIAAKKVDPNVRIIGVNCSGIDLEFSEQVFRYGGLDYCDILAYQPYRIAPEVGHFEEVAALRELVGRFGEQRPIWFTEVGWGSEHFPFRDANDFLAERPMRKQAAFLVRYMTIIQAVGIDKVFWFSQTAGGAGLEYHPTKTKRLSFYSYQHFLAAVGDYTRVRELHPHGAHGLYAYLFECPNTAVVIAWSANGPKTLYLPGLSAATQVRDMLGNPLAAPTSDETEVSGEPLYFIYDKAPQSCLDRAAVTVEPSSLWLAPGQEAAITVTRDADSSGKGCRFNIDAPGDLKASPRTLSLSPGESVAVAIRAREEARPQRHTVRIATESAGWNIEINVTPPVLWTYTGASEKLLQPGVLRRPDGSVDLLVASFQSPELLCLSAGGEKRWQYTAGAPLFDTPIATDLTGDGDPEIVTAMPNQNRVLLLSGNGVLQWRARIPGDPPEGSPSWRWTRPEVLDTGHIVYASASGHVTAWSPDGEMVWDDAISDSRCDGPIFVGDADGFPGQEILVGNAAGNLFCLASDGETSWHTDLGSPIAAAPLAAVLEPGTTPSVLAGCADERLVCLSDEGEALWDVQLGGTMDLGTGIAVADLNEDGTREIIASTRNHEVIAFDRTGAVLWRMEAGAQFRGTPQIGDIDADGHDEILIASADWLLYCIGPDGVVEWTAYLGARVDGSVLVADINGNGVPDVVAPVRGGKLVAYGL